MTLRNSTALSGALLLAGCATPPAPMPTLPSPPVAPQTTHIAVASDPQRCLGRTECTTKVSRTLLFVFDYAAGGGALVERRERLLFTPADTPRSDWPALRIRLAEPVNGRFDFASDCRVGACRYSPEELLQVYRRYLDGEPCVLPAPGVARNCTPLAH